MVAEPRPGTEGADYTERLTRLQTVWWKRVLDVQRPYRRHLQRLDLGFTLDVGCGVGRNLSHLGGNAVGVDHNAESVALVRAAGFRAFTPEEFARSEHARAGTFDSLLCAHVVEHMTAGEAFELLAGYLGYLRPSGRVVVITPQERGFRSDATHVELVDYDALERLAARLGLQQETLRSFPFPATRGARVRLQRVRDGGASPA